MRSSWMKMLVVAALITPMAALTACRNGEKTTDQPGVALAQPVAFGDGVSGSDKAALAATGLYLIKSQDQLEDLGVADLIPGTPVDFAAKDIVLLCGGEKPTGGYWVRIDAISQVGNELFVSGRANKPGEDAVTTQALTYPYHAVLIDKTSANIALPEITSVTGQSPN